MQWFLLWQKARPVQSTHCFTTPTLTAPQTLFLHAVISLDCRLALSLTSHPIILSSKTCVYFPASVIIATAHSKDFDALTLRHQVNYEWVEPPARKCGLCISDTQTDARTCSYTQGTTSLVPHVTYSLWQSNGENSTLSIASKLPLSLRFSYSVFNSLFSFYIYTVKHSHII